MPHHDVGRDHTFPPETVRGRVPEPPKPPPPPPRTPDWPGGGGAGAHHTHGGLPPPGTPGHPGSRPGGLIDNWMIQDQMRRDRERRVREEAQARDRQRDLLRTVGQTMGRARSAAEVASGGIRGRPRPPALEPPSAPIAERLLQFQPDPSITPYRIQTLADGHGRLNIDFHSIDVSRLPINKDGRHLTPAELLYELRLALTELSDGLAAFRPLGDEDAIRWNSLWPVGAQIHIDLGTYTSNIDDGTVVVSDASETSFVFSTIETPGIDKRHPVSGHREFGIRPGAGGNHVFYISGVDRPTGWLDALFEGTIFRSTDDLWDRVMENAASMIRASGGEATVGERSVERVPWRGGRER
jgi:hypothetical protein